MCKPRAILLPLAFSLISGLLLITARTSFAQLGPLSGPMGGGSSYGGLNNANDKPTAPPALPGAPALTPSTPSSARIPAGVSPTQALFQAIEAGKLDMAREALARGANIDAHNGLGQTPLSLSIDLNRNNITFLLLSLRDSLNMTEEAQTPTGNLSTPSFGRRSVENKPSTLSHRSLILRSRTQGSVNHRQVAEDSSADVPDPAAGFLGFQTTSGR